MDESAYRIFSDINVREFKRLLSNLINNAVEALENNGQVIVSLTQNQDYALLSITDNGHGIPSELLTRLTQKGETHGKKDGFGFGLYHARMTVESWGGGLKIESTINKGTTVSLLLPLAKASTWFVEQLNIFPRENIIILDDDISIHQIWNRRFENLNSKSVGVELLHFSTPDQLATWVANNKNEFNNSLFLIDYELIGFNQVGLDIIENT